MSWESNINPMGPRCTGLILGIGELEPVFSNYSCIAWKFRKLFTLKQRSRSIKDLNSDIPN